MTTPSSINVTPIITNPEMQNVKSGAILTSQQILSEMNKTDDIKNIILNSSQAKTNEEQLAEQEHGISTFMIIAFALIVIALIALIVWLVIKQNETSSSADLSLRQMLQHRQQRRPNEMPAYVQAQARAELDAAAGCKIEEVPVKLPVKLPPIDENDEDDELANIINATSTNEEDSESEEESEEESEDEN